MIEAKTLIFDKLFGEVDHWFEAENVLHIGSTTGKSCHWVAHPFCGKRIKGWIGFGEIQYAKTNTVCEKCLALHLISVSSEMLVPKIKVKKA